MRKLPASSRVAKPSVAGAGKISKPLQKKCRLRRNSKAIDDFSELGGGPLRQES